MRLGSWCALGAAACLGLSSPALAQQPAGLPRAVVAPPASSSAGASIKPTELHGVVVDDGGRPLAGAVVSAFGATSMFAVTDPEGRFVFRSLPPGSYLVRAHLADYRQARSRIVQVSARARTTSRIQLTRRPDGEAAAPAILAAGVGATDDEQAPPAETEVPHQHDEVAWRLRHQKRSVLKDAGHALAGLDPDQTRIGDSIATVGRAVNESARLASALLADLALTGQINLLTTTTFDRPQDLFTMDSVAPRGVAYLALGAPGADGDWSMRGTMTQGDLASWLVAGSYVRHRDTRHAYEAGVSYGMQRYFGGNGEALAALADGSRNAGAIYAFDHWTVSPRLRVSYGAKYARYDYLADRGLLSPLATVSWQPSARDPLTIRAGARHREVAPGAEEFLPPAVGIWLPPVRTFSQVSRGAFVPERHNQVEIAVERAWAGGLLIGVRAFSERVEDQMVTLFGVAIADTPAGVGHYQFGSAGDFEASGWGVSVSRTMGETFRASLDYTRAQARWSRRSPDAEALASLAASAFRADEAMHDLTASVDGVIPASATRLVMFYKFNTAFTPARALEASPAPGIRFDVQVNQALPFLDFTSARWEMLVAVSNLFREDLAEGSVYDEVLVVRPPKRVLGGVTVRF